MSFKLKYIPISVFTSCLILSFSPDANAQDSTPNEAVDVDPLNHTLKWGGCASDIWFSRYDGDVSYFPDKFEVPAAPVDGGSGKESAILTAIATSVITRGVDAVGNAIKKSSEEKTYSASANLNVLTDRNQNCLTFTGPDRSYRFVIRLERDESGGFVSPSLVEYDYNRNISGTSKTRGVVLTLAFKQPSETDIKSQSISLGNLKPSYAKTGVRTSHVIPLMANPFVKVSGNSVKPGFPFSATVTLTEVRDAHRLLSFVGDVSDDVNDDATKILIKVIGAEPNSTDAANDTNSDAGSSMGQQ